MDHSMAGTKNTGGGTKNHWSSLQHSSVYRQLYNSQNSGEPGDADDNVLPIVFVAVTGVVVLLRLLCCRMRKEEETGGRDRLGQPTMPSSQAGGSADRDLSTVATAVEMLLVRQAEPPLVCTYRKADGWRDDSCGVCLAELADGEALRVLPACMHFFHATCVNEWLRGHDTCPLCRAPLVAPGDAT